MVQGYGCVSKVVSLEDANQSETYWMPYKSGIEIVSDKHIEAKMKI